MIEHQEWVAAVAAVIRDREGNVDWRLIFHGIVTAAIVGLAATVVDQGREIAAIKASREATISGYEKRIVALENGTVSATSERYRRSDADREQAKTDARFDRLEERMTVHEVEDRLRFKGLNQR